MAIEIKELHITAVVKDQQETLPSAKKEKEKIEMIIASCIEQVLQILAEKTER